MSDLVKMNRTMQSCTCCPRNCNVNRLEGQRGVCRVPAEVYIARADLHFWEEPCISGTEGSGTVFFAGCPLKCVFCQNYEVANARAGYPVTIEELAQTFLKLQDKGALNINLVTPTQYAPQIAEALKLGRNMGLKLPIVYNCGGYEGVEALKGLEGLVDIWLTDFKYMNAETAARYSRCPDYPQKAKEALAEMVRQTRENVFDEEGRMKKGIIVRHLILPGHVREAQQLVRYLYETYGNRIWMSLMNQYTPFDRIKDQYPEISRKLTHREYNEVIDYTIDLGVENAYVQEGGTAKESFIPNFEGNGPDA